MALNIRSNLPSCTSLRYGDFWQLVQRVRPRPSADIDIDRVYDAAIRADLLARVLAEYQATGQLPFVEQQSEASTPYYAPYYVIHPILKHLSILSLKKGLAQ